MGLTKYGENEQVNWDKQQQKVNYDVVESRQFVLIGLIWRELASNNQPNYAAKYHRQDHT
jgi:hypothetical protein